MTANPTTGLEPLEVRLLAHLRREPAIICDLAAALHVPVPAVEALLHRLRRHGLVEARPMGPSSVVHWTVVP